MGSLIIGGLAALFLGVATNCGLLVWGGIGVFLLGCGERGFYGLMALLAGVLILSSAGF